MTLTQALDLFPNDNEEAVMDGWKAGFAAMKALTSDTARDKLSGAFASFFATGACAKLWSPLYLRFLKTRFEDTTRFCTIFNTPVYCSLTSYKVYVRMSCNSFVFSFFHFCLHFLSHSCMMIGAAST